MGTEPDTPKPAPRKSKALKWTVLAAVALLAVAAGSGAAWYVWRGAPAVNAAGPARGPTAHAVAGMIALEPFVVNLADTEASRYLRVNMRLVVKDGATVKQVEEDAVRMTRVRSSILDLLSTRTAAAVVSAEGKTRLRQEIVQRTASILDPLEVVDVLFTEFVVQY